MTCLHPMLLLLVPSSLKSFFVCHSCTFFWNLWRLIVIHGSIISLPYHKYVFLLSISFHSLGRGVLVFTSLSFLITASLVFSCAIRLVMVVILFSNRLQLCFGDVLLLRHCILNIDQVIVCLFHIILHECIGAVKSVIFSCGFLATSYFLLCLH